MGCAQIAVGLFLSSITESQIIAAVITFAVLFCSYVMDGISSFFSSTSSASFMTFLVISVLIALVVYQMTKDMILSSVLGIVLIAVNVVLYIVKSALYEGLIQKLLDLLSIANHFDSFCRRYLRCVRDHLYVIGYLHFCFSYHSVYTKTALELNLERRCRYESAKKEIQFLKN